MGIVAYCPSGHRMKVKDELAGRKGICPQCGSRFRIPYESQEAPAGGGSTRPPVAVAGSEPAATGPAAAPPTSASGLPVARVVSLDEDLAATLPRALPLAGGTNQG
jgi:hypothetical protein